MHSHTAFVTLPPRLNNFKLSKRDNAIDTEYIHVQLNVNYNTFL